MSTPMTSSQIKAQLIKWRVPFKEYRSWSTHNRTAAGRPWGPVHGLVIHHTGSDSTDQRALLYDGISGLPGPLSQFGLAQDGTVWLIGWGRANHAGGGDPASLSHVINEDYATRTTNLKPTRGNSDGIDGNRHFYGVEIWYSGSHGMTPQQYASLLLLAAAIDDFHDWTALANIAHGEWSDDKWDPGISSGKTMNMVTVRKDIQAKLNAGIEDEDMTPDQDARLKRVENALAELTEAIAVAPWTYRNKAKDDASVAAGKGRIPDMHQVVQNISTDVKAIKDRG